MTDKNRPINDGYQPRIIREGYQPQKPAPTPPAPQPSSRRDHPTNPNHPTPPKKE